MAKLPRSAAAGDGLASPQTPPNSRVPQKTNSPEIVFNNSPLPSLHRVINIPLRSRALTQPVINVSSAANLFLCKLILQGAETSGAVDVCAQPCAPCAPASASAPRFAFPAQVPSQKVTPTGLGDTLSTHPHGEAEPAWARGGSREPRRQLGKVSVTALTAGRKPNLPPL